jgi:Na+-translocating ferredoxin:NAD+ oxidoreductase RnfG subunit
MRYRFLLFFIVVSVLFFVAIAEAGMRNYASVDEVLARSFPKAAFDKRVVRISNAERKKVEGFIKKKFFKRQMVFYIASKDGAIQGYAVIGNERGKTRRITFMVLLDKDGVVKDIDILAFRESQGYEVENPAWRRQFRGKTVRSRLRLKRDISNISGATLSARAVTKGVKNILAAFHVLRPRLDKGK